MSQLEFVAVSIGNTRTRVGFFRGRSLESAEAISSDDLPGLVGTITRAAAEVHNCPIVIASVKPKVSEELLDELRTARGEGHTGEAFLFGRDLAIPIQTGLEDEATVGQDRLLNALGAYSRAEQACIVVDAGTAVTVDFVDGQGTFQGGAIAPGVNMMLRALHDHTAALPEVRFEPVSDEQTFGRDTRTAMLLGVQSAVLGMVRHLAERFGEAYGAYPQIVATGGDARALFENDDLIETIVPDLTLIGMQAACAAQLAGEEDEEVD